MANRIGDNLLKKFKLNINKDTNIFEEIFLLYEKLHAVILFMHTNQLKSLTFFYYQ